MTQKVLKVGTSAAVTLSKEAMKFLGIDIGDRITVDIDKKKKIVKIESISKTVDELYIDKELLSWTEQFIKEYRPALKELAKK